MQCDLVSPYAILRWFILKFFVSTWHCTDTGCVQDSTARLKRVLIITLHFGILAVPILIMIGQSIYFITEPTDPLLNSLQVDLSYVGLWVNVRIRVRGFE